MCDQHLDRLIAGRFVLVNLCKPICNRHISAGIHTSAYAGQGLAGHEKKLTVPVSLANRLLGEGGSQRAQTNKQTKGAPICT